MLCLQILSQKEMNVRICYSLLTLAAMSLPIADVVQAQGPDGPRREDRDDGPGRGGPGGPGGGPGGGRGGFSRGGLN